MTRMIRLKSFISADFQVMTHGISTAADWMNLVLYSGSFGFEFWIGVRPWWVASNFFWWRSGLTEAMASSFTRFLDHSQRRTTVGRTSLYEWLALRRDLYLTTHNTHKRETSIPPVVFEPQSQQASGRRPTPYTARPLGPVLLIYTHDCSLLALASQWRSDWLEM